jgi:16S rRNA (guanine527-N7)-methyltransferase
MLETQENILPQNLEIWQNTLAWQPTQEQQDYLQKLYQRVLLGNQQFNLTRITEPEEFWEKHLWDSLAGILKIPVNLGKTSTLIDIGSGAGFPGIPTAIVRPDWTVSLLDSTQKKVNFLNSVIEDLSLKNANTLLGRAEVIGKTKAYKASYDVALIRAVANAAICAEYSLPLLKLGGIAVLYRGNWTEEETESLSVVLDTLGGKIEKVESFSTPISQSIRHCIYLKKTTNSSKLKAYQINFKSKTKPSKTSSPDKV